MSGYESDLMVGLAQYLNDAGVGVYRPDGGYLPGDTAIVFGDLPPTPDRCIGLTPYSSTDQPKIALSRVRVQVWMRGAANDSLDILDLATDVFDTLQGAERLQFGSAGVVQILRVSAMPMGIDANKRSERSDNYAVDVNPPATPGRPD